MNPSSSIRWPAEFAAETHPVQVSNEIDLAVPPDQAWAWLIRAEHWPCWYANAKRVRILEGPRPDLAKGTRFHWWTFSTPITSQVLEFDPYERLAWNAKGPGIRAYHAWLITPTPTGCHVLTEERQHGFGARLHARLFPNSMHQGHKMWLEGLRNKSAGGPPPLP
jgi:uncharacterized protein YndB with AHSA1/START domain